MAGPYLKIEKKKGGVVILSRRLFLVVLCQLCTCVFVTIHIWAWVFAVTQKICFIEYVLQSTLLHNRYHPPPPWTRWYLSFKGKARLIQTNFFFKCISSTRPDLDGRGRGSCERFYFSKTGCFKINVLGFFFFFSLSLPKISFNHYMRRV